MSLIKKRRWMPFMIFQGETTNSSYRADRCRTGVFLLASGYFIFLFLVNLKRYSGNANIHDLFIFENAMWNTLHGRIFWSFYEFGNHLGVHFSPGLFLLVPFYALVQHPFTLLFLQSLAVAASGIVLYYLGLKVLDDQISAFLLSLSFCLSPAVLGTAFSGFHAVVFVLPFLFLLFLAHEKGDKTMLALFTVTCLLWRETIVFPLLIWGAVLLLKKNTKDRGLIVFLISLAWGVWAFFILMPLIRGTSVTEGLMQYRFPREIGHSPGEIISNFFRNPGLFFHYVFQWEKIAYLVFLFGSLLFLPLISPLTVLPILPVLAQNLLSRYGLGASLQKHYSAAIIPFLVYAAMLSIHKIASKYATRGKEPEKIKRLLCGMVIIASLMFLIPSDVFDTFILGRVPEADKIHQLSPGELRVAKEMGEEVPEEASLAAAGHLAKYFARRRVICFINKGFLKIFPFDYLLYFAPEPKYDLFSNNPELAGMLEEKYTLLKKEGRLRLYKRKPVQYTREEAGIIKAVPE